MLKLFTLLSLLSFSLFANEDQAGLSVGEGQEILHAYDQLIDYVDHREVTPVCLNGVEPIKQDTFFCNPELIMSAASYFYLKDKKAKSNLWQNLKSRGGPWRSGDIYLSGFDVDVYDYTLTIKGRGKEKVIISFPQVDINQPIKAEFTSDDGSVDRCISSDSLDILKMSAATVDKWNQLSKEQRENWKNFCAEYKSYEDRAMLFEKNNWSMYEKSQNGDREQRVTYMRCPAGIRWKEIAAQALCGGTTSSRGGYPMINPHFKEYFPNLLIPESFMYFFDGYGDFNAERALFLANAENVTGDEKGDMILGMKNGNGLGLYFDSLGYDYGVDKVQMLYYDGTDQKQSHGSTAAANCHRDMDDWIKVIRSIYPDVKKPKRVAMGYSNGGAASLSFQKKISRDGFFGKQEETQLDLLITVDPISRPGSFALNRMTGINLLGRRRDTTARYVNIYQDSDYGSFAPLRLTSQAAANADQNIHLSAEDLNAGNGKYAHVKITRSDFVRDKVRCEFDNTLNETGDLCDYNPMDYREVDWFIE